MRGIEHHAIQRQRAHHLGDLAAPRQRTREIHEPAALGVDRSARLDQALDLGAQGAVVVQSLKLRFRKPPADEQTVERRQLLLRKRVDEHELRAGKRQVVQIVRIVKPEGAVPEHAEADA